MKEKFENKIIVPIDFSDHCRHSIFHAMYTAKQLKSEVILIHVINHQRKVRMQKENISIKDLEEKFKTIQDKYSQEKDINISFLIREGNLFEVITTEALEQKAYMMVLAAHKKTGLKQWFGDNALKLVTKSPIPTLVVQDSEIHDYAKKMVFPIHNFTEARQKVQWAILLSKVFKLTVHILRQHQSEIDSKYRLNIITEQIEEEFQKYDVPFILEETETGKHFADSLIEYAGKINANMITILTNADIFSPDFNHVAWDEKIMYNKENTPVLMINPDKLGEVYYEYLTLF
ncbi:MAG: universal stress protein [Bacteroidales bacterium]